ncbi:MAG: hypothetical protein WC718_07170 [Phycisphaerales bacterium]|jgi:hypothetical protein
MTTRALLIALCLLAALLLVGCVVPAEDGATARTAPQTGCRFDSTTQRGSLDIDVAISGSHRTEVWVDVYAPGPVKMDYYGKVLPLPVQSQFNKRFTNTDEPYVHQTYSSYELKSGSYRVTARYGSKDYEWTVQIASGEAVTFYVDCG